MSEKTMWQGRLDFVSVGGERCAYVSYNAARDEWWVLTYWRGRRRGRGFDMDEKQTVDITGVTEAIAYAERWCGPEAVR